MKPVRMKKKKKKKSRVAPAPAAPKSRAHREITLTPNDNKSSKQDLGFFALMKRKAHKALREIGLVKALPAGLVGDAAKIAEYLEFSTRDVDRIKIVFDDIDFDESGEIDYDEFLKFSNEPRSPYTDALMNMVDEEGTGVLNFNMFFRLICMYCVYTQEDILQFVFQTFDKDSSGTLDEEEFMDLARTVNNADPLFPGNFKTALERFDVNEDGLLDYKEFKGINKDFPMVFYPAFRIQNVWHQSCLGEKFWVDVAINIQRRKFIEEYMLTHNGQLPPPTLKERLRKIFCSCCARSGKFEAGKERRKRRKKNDTAKRRKRKSRTKDREGESDPSYPKRLTARERKILVEQQTIRKTVKTVESKRAW